MILRSAFGLVALCAIAWLLGENRRKVRWRTVFAGIGLQVALAILLLRFPPSRVVFLALNNAMEGLTTASEAGTSFVFGYLGGAALPFQKTGASE